MPPVFGTNEWSQIPFIIHSAKFPGERRIVDN